MNGSRIADEFLAEEMGVDYDEHTSDSNYLTKEDFQEENNYFESLDGLNIIPFSQVVRVSKNDNDKRFIRVYYPSQFSNSLDCSYHQLQAYKNWLNKK